MRLLIYDINYAPELTGIGKYTGEMGAWLARQGHTVHVITAMPYYPEWEVHPTYRGRGWFTERLDGVVVHRCPFYVPKNVTAARRILHEFSFVLSSLVYWLPFFFRRRFDVVMGIAPPFHAGLMPLLYSRLRHVPLWMHLQDLQIDMAKELKMLTNPSLLNLLFRTERFILQRTTGVSTISEGMVRKTAEKVASERPCVLFPNWVDDTYIRPLSPEASMRSELGIAPTARVVLYSGNLGEKQGLEMIVEAARHFNGQPDVVFLICGSGGGKARLQAMVADYQLRNVLFVPLQPYKRLSALLAVGDLHLVLQKKSASDLVLPSKLTSILAAGGCALVTAVDNTTLHTIMTHHQMGIVVEPESLPALLDGIYQALQSDLSAYRQNARAYASRHLSKETILHQFQNELLRLAHRVTDPTVAEESTTPSFNF